MVCRRPRHAVADGLHANGEGFDPAGDSRSPHDPVPERRADREPRRRDRRAGATRRPAGQWQLQPH